MKTSTLSRAVRLLLAGSLVAALVSCGGSDTTSSNRDNGRNSALEECATDTTAVAQSDASGKSDDNKDKDGNTEDNNNGGGVTSENCSPDTTFAETATHRVQCDATWNPAESTVTLCDNFQYFKIKQYDAGKGELKDVEQEVEDEIGGNTVPITVDPRAQKIGIEVGYKKKSDKKAKKVTTLSFDVDTSSTSTFTYEAEGSGDGSTDTTAPVSDTTAPASDTTAPVSDTTAPASDTTAPVSDTTAPVSDTTAPASDTTAPASDSTVATNSIEENVVLIAEKERCEFTWRAATRTIESCKEFDAFSAAIYGKDGSYTGRYEANGTSVSVPENVVSGDGLGFAHVEVAASMDQLDIQLWLGDGWITIPDVNQDASVTVELDDKNSPSINTVGDARSAEFITDGDVMLISRAFMVFERDGVPHRNTNITIEPGKTSTWRAFLPDAFGYARLAAAGIHPADQVSWDGFSYYDPFDVLSLQTVQVIDGESTANSYDMAYVDKIIGSMETDPCKDVSPVLVMSPQSPSAKNRVTVSMDADCASSNHYMGFIVVPKSESAFWWWDINIQYASFASTRYSSVLSVSMYLPDGDYIIVFGSVGSISITDYQVNGKGSRADCAQAHLQITEARKTGVLEGCKSGDFPWTGLAMIDSQFGLDFSIMPAEGGKVDLSNVPFTGYFYGIAIGLQGFLGWNSQVTPFLMCVTDCDAPPADPKVTVDQSQFNSSGIVVATHDDCTDEYWGGAVYWHQYKSNYAYEWAGAFDLRAPGVVPYPGKGFVDIACESYSEETGYTFSRALSQYDLKGELPEAPANDEFRDAQEVQLDEWVGVSNVNATVQTGEPTLSWSQNFARQSEASVWYKFTPTQDGPVNVYLEDNGFGSNWQVFRGSKVSKLGYVTGTYCLTWLFFGDCINDLSFGAKAGNTYYIRISGGWWASQGYAGMQVSQNMQPAGDFVAPDTTNPGDGGPTDTTTPATDTTAAAPDTTAVPATDTTPAPDVTTGGMGTDTTAPPVSSTPDTTAAPGGTTDTTVPSGGPSDEKTALNEAFNTAAAESSSNEKARVVEASSGNDGVVEVRLDTATVEMPVGDLYSVVSLKSDSVSRSRGLVVVTKGRRPIVVPAGAKTVQLPAGTDVESLTVQAADAEGKPVVATLQVKRVLKPVFTKDTGSGGGSMLLVGISAALLLLLLLAFFFMKKRKNEETPAQA